MTLPAYCILDLVLLASEITLAASRRSRPGEAVGKDRDRGSWRLLWIVTCLAMTAGHLLSLSGVGPELTPVVFWRRLGIGVFVAGLLLRGWAIRHLGQFFTVNVVVASNQRVVDDGPYRYVRHPTYTGLLLEFAGIGLTLGSLTGLLVIIVPVFLVLSRRVRVEEAALAEVLGAPYTDYMRRTKRFVPGLF
jgi:protein-S-isoprenylcysteine O-methyltransferase Ste14